MVDAGKKLIRSLFVIAAFGLLAMGCSTGGSALNKDGSSGLAKVQNIEVKEASGLTDVLVKLDRQVTYTMVKIDEPPMVVVDLAGVDLGESAARMDVGKDPVLYIKPSRDTVSKNIARLEIGLSRQTQARITQDGGLLSIVFDRMAPETADASAEAGLVAPSAENSAPDLTASAPTETPTASGQSVAPGNTVNEAAQVQDLPAATTINGVKFTKSGKSVTVDVEADGRLGERKVFMVGNDRLVIDLFGVGSVKDKDTIKVGGDCVKRIRMASHETPDKKVRLVLDLGCEVDYDVNSQGSDMVVAVGPKGSNVVASVKPSDVPAVDKNATAATAVSGKPTAADAPVGQASDAARKVTVSIPPAPEAKVASLNPAIYVTQKDGKTVLSSSPIGDTSGASKVVGSDKDFVVTETKIYTGGKISFDIQDADLDKVIKLLAEVAGLNLIINPGDVKGKVTLKLANVPWDQALDILLKIYKLDKVIEGNVLRVAPKSKLTEERKVDLREIAEQKRLMEEAEDLYTKTFKISYSDASDLEGKVKKILTKRGEATANPRTNELIVTDIRNKIEEAGQLINILDKEVNQILIEARIVTVDLGFSQSLGVSWGLARNPTGTAPQPAAYGASGSNSSVEFDEPSSQYLLAVPTELGKDVAGIVTGMTWLGIMDNVNLDLTISALESINKAETLAAPKVLTLENKPAQITQGTTLYVQTTSASGTKPEPLNANLSLTVTPRVTGDNFISMDVNATNNTPSTPPPGSTAAIETQAVKTNVVVKNGDTIVLGGIYVKTKSKGDAQIPWLGRIPILGWLFKERDTNETTSELLIFITPKLIKQEQQVRT